MTKLIQLGIPAWLILTMGSCLPMVGGCGPKATSMDQFQQKLDTLSKFARENDVVIVVTANLSDDVGLYGKQEFGIHSGINAQASVVLNSSDEELPVIHDPSIPAGVVGTGHP